MISVVSANATSAITMISPNGVTQRRHANWWVSHAGSNGHERKSRIMRPNACICWDNMMRLPILPQLDLFAQRLAEMDTTIDQHSMALRVPYIIGVEEGGEKNAEALYNRIAAGEGAVYYYRGGPAAVPIQVLTTMPAAAYAGDKLLNDHAAHERHAPAPGVPAEVPRHLGRALVGDGSEMGRAPHRGDAAGGARVRGERAVHFDLLRLGRPSDGLELAC